MDDYDRGDLQSRCKRYMRWQQADKPYAPESSPRVPSAQARTRTRNVLCAPAHAPEVSQTLRCGGRQMAADVRIIFRFASPRKRVVGRVVGHGLRQEGNTELYDWRTF